MRFNWFFVFIGLFLIGMLAINVKFFRGTGHASVGVTYSKGYRINADRSALVKTIAVVPGQQVKVGDVLVELTSFNLELELDRLQNRITTLKSERAEKSKLAKSEIAYIKADQGIEIEKLNVAIIQTESELALNKKLSNEFSEQELNENNPLRQKIEALKLQRMRYEEAIRIKIADILQETSTEEYLLDNQVRLLEQEREMHLAEKNNLRKVAIVDGVVESIFVKPGEQVDAYSELLSVNPVHPTTVVGYLVGKKNALPVGADVVVKSYENQNMTTPGKVIGYGSVVPLPEILQKSTAVTGFGREFFVEISAQNSFANGERVLIR
jgi:multidrug resistance efflux pump